MSRNTMITVVCIGLLVPTAGLLAFWKARTPPLPLLAAVTPALRHQPPNESFRREQPCETPSPESQPKSRTVFENSSVESPVHEPEDGQLERQQMTTIYHIQPTTGCFRIPVDLADGPLDNPNGIIVRFVSSWDQLTRDQQRRVEEYEMNIFRREK